MDLYLYGPSNLESMDMAGEMHVIRISLSRADDPDRQADLHDSRGYQNIHIYLQQPRSLVPSIDLLHHQ